MASQTVEVKAVGLFTSPNRLNLPPGALIQAVNAVCARPGVIDPRRGFRRTASLTNSASALGEYLGTLLALDGTTLKRATDADITSWTSITGTFSPPDDTRMQFLEANLNFYFTTDAGVYTMDSLAATPVRSGIPEGLDCQLSLTGTGASWFTPDTQVGYRHTWKRTDANNNAKQGAPSFQERLANPTSAVTWSRAGTTSTITHTAHGYTTGDTISVLVTSDTSALPLGSYTITVVNANTYTITVPNAGGTTGTATVGKAFNVSLTVTIPSGIAAGDVLEVWRTDLSADADTSPGDDHRLITSYTVVSGDLATGTITVLDTFDSFFFKDNLYTNAGLETTAQANHRPPLAKHIFTFEGHTFYLDAVQPHEKEIQLIAVAGLVDDTSSLTIAGRTYTFSAAENQGALKFQRFTAGLLSENLEDTMKSLQKIINRDTSATVYAHYISGEEDAPGRLLIVARNLGTDSFAITCNNSTTSTKFTPNIPTSGTTYSSTNNAKPNGAWRSKANQPEAVPKLNFHVFGKANRGTSGATALKEAAIIWKDDGLFVLSGQSDGASGAAFNVDELDPTVICNNPNTLTLFDNAAFGSATQGIARAGQGNPAVVSRPQIETDLLRISKFDNFDLAHAVSYESEQLYILFVPEFSTDDTCTIAYVYHAGTNAWTGPWRKPVAVAHVLTSDDLLYLAHATEPYVLQERKSRTPSGADFVDEDIDVTITGTGTTVNDDGDTVSTVTLTYTYTGADLVAGWTLNQGTTLGIIDSVTNNGMGSYTVRLTRLHTGFANGAATVGMAYDFLIEWAPVHTGNPASLKQFPYAQVYLERSSGSHFLGFEADTQSAPEYTDELFHPKATGWGSSPWGSSAWGSSRPGASRPVRSRVPINHQICRSLSVIYKSTHAREPHPVLCMSLDVIPISTRTERQP